MLKRKSFWIKLFIGLMVCLGTVSLFANGGQAGSGSVVSTTGNYNTPGTFPIAKNTVTFNVAMRQDTGVENYDTNAYTKMLEEKGNVKFNFNIYPAGSPGQEKIQVEIAGGGTLPEMLINFGFNDEQIFTYGNDGIFPPLNQYYDKLAYYIPQAVDKLADKDFMRKLHSPDGNIYFLPFFVEQIGEMYALRGWMNTKWLDTLGLKSPTTTAEFRTVLEAFRDRDPNGNGIRDEIPAGGNTDVRGRLHEYLMNAFIYSDTRDRLIVNNGKVEAAYVQPEWRDGLRYINGLMNDGLILDQLFTISGGGLRSIIESQDVATVGFFTAGLAGALSPTNPMRLEYAPIPPLKGPNGVQWSVYMPTPLNSRYIITKDCKDPEVAFLLGDYMCSEDASIWLRFGIPNVDWRLPQPGEKSMYEAVGMSARIVPILAWGSTQNSHWAQGTAGILPLGILDGQVTPPNPLDNERWVAAAAPMYMNLAPPANTRVDFTQFSFDEMQARKDLELNITAYVSESMAQFIMGQKSVDKDWDSYVAELNRMGLQQYLQLTQSGYDRAIGIKK